MSEWIEWKGGECPVGAGAEVEIRFDDGEAILTYQPTMWDWDHAPGNERIIAYRVISQAPADENARLTARIKRLEEALSSIDVYLSDTLSGRVKGDPATYKDWLIEGIREARNRARAAYKDEPDAGKGGAS